MESILKLLQFLEDEILNSKKAMLSGNRIIDERSILDIVEEIRKELPSVILEARAILRDRSEVVESTQRKAEQITREANEHAQMLVMNSEVVKRAAKDADNIMAEAVGYKNYIIKETRAVLDGLFVNAESKLTTILNDIRDSRAGMHEELDHSGKDR